MSAYLKRLQIDSVEESVEHPSAYLKRVEIVEVVDSNGNPWEPVPGPDPWDELVVADKALLHESNIYAIGETVYATTATYTGGDPDQTTYRWRWQWRQASEGSWANSPWTSYDNTLKQVSYTIPNAGQIRFQCQGSDESQDPVVRVSDFTSVKDVPYNEFGELSVTVNDIAYDTTVAAPLTVLMNDPLPAVVSIAGNATPTYVWSARGDYPIMVGQQAASTVLTFPTAGAVTVTCTLTDSNTEEYNTSVVINFFVVDALD